MKPIHRLRRLCVICGLPLLLAKIYDNVREGLRILLVRQVPAIEKHDKPRTGYLLVQPLAVREWNLDIVFTPEQQGRLLNKMRVSGDALCIPTAHRADDRALRA